MRAQVRRTDVWCSHWSRDGGRGVKAVEGVEWGGRRKPRSQRSTLSRVGPFTSEGDNACRLSVFVLFVKGFPVMVKNCEY